MEDSFKKAILFSTAIHILIFGPIYKLSSGREIESPKPIVVEYVVIKEKKAAEPEHKLPEPKVSEAPRVEIEKEVDLKKDESFSKKESKIKATRDYINYYQLIREKIRRRLKVNYKNYQREGDVHLGFILNSDGSLIAHEIEQAKSTDDKILIDIADLSLRESSPFPAFPKGVGLPRMSFNLVISFRKR